MKCFEDVNKRQAIETELHRLLDSVKYSYELEMMGRDIGDSTSLVTYMMAFIEQKQGSLDSIRENLIKDTEIFLTSGIWYAWSFMNRCRASCE